MPVKTQDRPINIVREEVIDQLIVNYGHEELSLEAFERRLDQALASDDPEELTELVADLELQADKDYSDQKREELDLVLEQKAVLPHHGTGQAGAGCGGSAVTAVDIIEYAFDALIEVGIE